jgi:uncharacterized membrane protein YadS
MSWLNSATSSLWGGVSIAPSEAQLEERTEEIRQAMISLLGKTGSLAYPALHRRLMFAANTEGLWYLRSEWMSALSMLYGERVAAAHLRSTNIQFEGVLTKGMSSRPSPLSSIQ